MQYVLSKIRHHSIPPPPVHSPRLVAALCDGALSIPLQAAIFSYVLLSARQSHGSEYHFCALR